MQATFCCSGHAYCLFSLLAQGMEISRQILHSKPSGLKKSKKKIVCQIKSIWPGDHGCSGRGWGMVVELPCGKSTLPLKTARAEPQDGNARICLI